MHTACTYPPPPSRACLLLTPYLILPITQVNAPNIKDLLPELFAENLLRGRGLFCQAVMKAQLASPGFSALYAALAAVVNTKFPELGELLCHRIIAQVGYRVDNGHAASNQTAMVIHTFLYLHTTHPKQRVVLLSKYIAPCCAVQACLQAQRQANHDCSC